MKKFSSLTDFYPYYYSEHQNGKCRLLHLLGTSLALLAIILSIVTSSFYLAFVAPLVGYGFAWTGHFFFEKNRPATFKYPIYSFISDFVMFYRVITGKEKINPGI